MKHILDLHRQPLETKEAPDAGFLELKNAFAGYHSEVAAQAAEIKRLAGVIDNMQVMLAREPVGIKSARVPVTPALVAAEHKAFGLYIKTGDETELKSLDTETGPQAGYVVNTNLATTINKKIYDQSPIRRLARIVTVDQGDVWEEPLDFSDIGATWGAERQARTETENPSLRLLTIPLREIYAHQTVTQKLMDLSYINIGGWIEGKISDKFGRTEGLAYVTGIGPLEPTGFMSYATDSVPIADATRPWGKLQHVISGSATTVADANGQADGIKNLYWSLRAPYRTNASWLMSSATANGIDKLKDADGNYIWRAGMTAGAPPSLLGRPVEFDENMPSPGAGTFPIAFGDFSKAYTILDWSGIKSLRDPYTNKPNVIFYAYRRTGGDVSNFEAIKLLKCAAS